VLLEIKAVEDDVVEVGGELAIVGEPAESAVLASAPTPATEEPVEQSSTLTEPEPAAPTSAAPTSAASAGVPPVDSSDIAASSTGELQPVVLPALGESVTEGTVTRWLKAVGDEVAVDEPLLEVSTDKVDTEIPAPAAGVLAQVLVSEDETVEVGAVLGLIGSVTVPTAARPAPTAPTNAPASDGDPNPQPTPDVHAVAATANGGASLATGADNSVYASPIARKHAREAGVDISAVTPTGRTGRITNADIRAAATTSVAVTSPSADRPQLSSPADSAPPANSAPPADGSRSHTEPMTRLRRVIAERMVESLQVSAQLTTVVEVDVTRIASLRARVKDGFVAREGVSLSFLPFFARATLEALRQHPNVNASVDSAAQSVTFHDSIHLGIAVDTERGLLVPVIRDAGDLTLSGLARRITDLAQRTRTSKVAPDELSGGTFTLTNTGSRGALFDTPIINQPQVAILGTGAVVKRPMVVSEPDGQDAIAIRSMAYFALTYDHRLVDGADAARFLGAIKARLEGADFEAELGL
jgi:2-oxoglutarate dehydrogenase E2 component (dihydrolipoamide succinyltransferase)